MRDEQALLRLSIAATIVLAAAGVIVGLIAGSAAIVFDGVYGAVDAVMTVLALLVAKLIAASNAADAVGRNYSQRFTMGFWHLEPIALLLNGMLLTGAAIYALIDAVGVILAGGRALSFDLALAYAAIGTAADVCMAAYITRANRRIGSALVALDAKAWGMTAALGAALFCAFLLGHAVQGTRLAWISPYVDPVALLLICVVIIPVPFATVRRALGEILLVTPQDLRDQVDAVARDVVARYGFISHHAFVARVGRGVQIELNFVVPPDWPAKRLEEWDALRDRIGEALGNDGPDLWLTIVFTSDPEWAW
jgi:predicted Co/Zn/Cd cation transporter (cation efflux family)